MQNYFAITPSQIKNAEVDFSPLGNALDDLYNSKRQAKQDAIAAEERQNQRRRQSIYDKRATLEHYGKASLAIQQLPEAQRAGAWSSLMARYRQEHPNDNLSAEDLDWKTGPSRMSAAAGQFLDPLDRQFKQSEIEKNLSMSRNYESEAQSRQTERDMINSLLKGGAPAATSSIPQNGQVIPQSNNVPTNQNPNLIKVADQNNPTVPQVSAPQEPTIMTRFGPMTKEQARAYTMLPNQGLQNFGKSLLEDFNNQNFQKSTQGEFEKKILDTTEHLANLRAIEEKYNRDFLTYKEQGKQFFTSLKEKAGVALTPEQKARRTQYIQFQQDSIDNVNDMIRAATGAAMGKEEAERLMLSEANLNDDPTAFEAKLKNSTTKLRLALYRYNYLRSQQKFTGSGEDIASRMTLKTMENIIDRRADQLKGQIQQQFPQMQKQEMNNLILRKIDEEFGGNA